MLFKIHAGERKICRTDKLNLVNIGWNEQDLQTLL